jgi:DNA-binding NarL/FixJ family response regulator
VRVIICEDNALLRDSLERLLTGHGLQVVASVASAEAFLEAVDRVTPYVCVVDVRLPPTFTDEGIRAALEARRRLPALPILILSHYVEQTYARELLRDGHRGVGYLMKDRVADPANFVDAVRRVGGAGPPSTAKLLRRRFQAGTNRRSSSCLRRGAPGSRADGRRSLKRRHRREARHHRAR